MVQDERTQGRARWGQVVARAWRDPAYKQQLLAEPAAVLREAGIEVPAGQQVRVVENTDQVVHLVLPQQPAGTLSDEQLDQVAGGVIPFPPVNIDPPFSWDGEDIAFGSNRSD